MTSRTIALWTVALTTPKSCEAYARRSEARQPGHECGCYVIRTFAPQARWRWRVGSSSALRKTGNFAQRRKRPDYLKKWCVAIATCWLSPPPNTR
jgi:hypothetical protein